MILLQFVRFHYVEVFQQTYLNVRGLSENCYWTYKRTEVDAEFTALFAQ
jgi:hypothetical protein